jgi:hypothetical protein
MTTEPKRPTFEDFPPRAKSLDFNIDDMMEALNPPRSR